LHFGSFTVLGSLVLKFIAGRGSIFGKIKCFVPDFLSLFIRINNFSKSMFLVNYDFAMGFGIKIIACLGGKCVA